MRWENNRSRESLHEMGEACTESNAIWTFVSRRFVSNNNNNNNNNNSELYLHDITIQHCKSVESMIITAV